MTLADSSPMPFHEYHGVEMRHIPAQHYRWLWVVVGMSGRTYTEAGQAVKEYISARLDQLKAATMDLSWDAK